MCFNNLLLLHRYVHNLFSCTPEFPYYSIKARGKFIDSLNKEQAETAKEGALSVLTADDTKEYIDYKIQRTISNLVNEILDNL